MKINKTSYKQIGLNKQWPIKVAMAELLLLKDLSHNIFCHLVTILSSSAPSALPFIESLNVNQLVHDLHLTVIYRHTHFHTLSAKKLALQNCRTQASHTCLNHPS